MLIQLKNICKVVEYVVTEEAAHQTILFIIFKYLLKYF